MNGLGNKMTEVRGIGMGQGLQTNHPVDLKALSVGERFLPESCALMSSVEVRTLDSLLKSRTVTGFSSGAGKKVGLKRKEGRMV